MKWFKYWTRPTAVTILVVGFVLIALGLAGILIAGPDATAAYGVLVGAAAGLGIALLAAAIVWLMRWRGQSDEQIRTTMKQVFDERFYGASERASRITTVATALFLVACGAWYGSQDNLLTAWLFVGGAAILGIGRIILTRVFLRVK